MHRAISQEDNEGIPSNLTESARRNDPAAFAFPSP